MALVMTLLTVVGILGGVSLLLWFSAFFEGRNLGPSMLEMASGEPAVEEPPMNVAA